MRVLRMLDKKKACIWDPCSSSAVHPSIEEETRRNATVMELLGVGSPQERHEDGLLRSRSSQFESSTSSSEDSCDEDENEVANHESAVALPHPSDSCNPTRIITADLSNATLREVVMQPPVVKANFLQLATSHWGLKLLKFHCLADTSVVVNNPRLYGKASPFQLEKGTNNACNRDTHKILPLPLPYTEKHLLPSPRRKDESLVAHPLPQPPLSRSSSNQASEDEVNDREESTSCSLLNANELRTREAVPLPSMAELAKAAQLSSLETSIQRLSAYKLSSPSSSARESPRQCHILPRPLSGGAALNSPSTSQAKPLCLPPSSGGSSLNSPAPFLDSKTQCVRSGGPTLNSPSSSPASKPLCPRKWRKGAILGQGTFGIVHEGLNLEDGSFFAVKVSSTQDTSPEIQQEVDLLSKLEHPNIVRYLGSSIEDGRLCIYIELVRMGSLEAILRKYKRFEEKTIRSYTRQILHGLEYLHAQKTIHRDIKCANILVDVNGQVKLSDFGVAKQVGEILASSSKGTPLYMAPEVLTPRQNCYSFSADIWSLGCTVLEMADGKPPWSDLEGFGFLFKVSKGELPPMPEHLSPEGRDFVCRCLKFHAKDRPTASELLQHPFVICVPSPEPSVPWVPLSPTPSFFALNSRTCKHKPPSSIAQCTL